MDLLTFPLQVIAIRDELEWVGFIWSVDVVNVYVQVIRRVQEVIWQQRTFTLIQGEVHLRGDQRTPLPVGWGHAAAASSSRWAHVQGGRMSYSETRGQEERDCDSCHTERGLSSIMIIRWPPTCWCYLQVLSSVRPQEGSMSPYSGSGLVGNMHTLCKHLVLCLPNLLHDREEVMMLQRVKVQPHSTKTHHFSSAEINAS